MLPAAIETEVRPPFAPWRTWPFRGAQTVGRASIGREYALFKMNDIGTPLWQISAWYLESACEKVYKPVSIWIFWKALHLHFRRIYYSGIASWASSTQKDLMFATTLQRFAATLLICNPERLNLFRYFCIRGDKDEAMLSITPVSSCLQCWSAASEILQHNQNLRWFRVAHYYLNYLQARVTLSK